MMNLYINYHLYPKALQGNYIFKSFRTIVNTCNYEIDENKLIIGFKEYKEGSKKS